MKRSRVVDLINNQIEGYMNPSSSRYTAEKILRSLEEVGMLPPNRKPSKVELNIEDEDLYQECLYFNTYNNWEPEE